MCTKQFAAQRSALVSGAANVALVLSVFVKRVQVNRALCRVQDQIEKASDSHPGTSFLLHGETTFNFTFY